MNSERGFTHPENRHNPERDEIDRAMIEKRFVEAPSAEVRLLANHLMRPDGFVKTLILGDIRTSAELKKTVGQDFVKTHRGWYMSYPPNHYSGSNDYVSFNVGKAQGMYAVSGRSSTTVDDEWRGGLGFVMPAEALLGRPDVRLSWGMLGTNNALKKIRDTPLFEDQFRSVQTLPSEEERDRDWHPKKDDILLRVHISRKAGMLTGTDQAEANIHAAAGEFPKLSVQETVILIPDNRRAAFIRLVEKKLKEIQPCAEKLQRAYGIDVAALGADTVLARHPNIYWYPQDNAGLASEYLSTHPERIASIISV
ncbi:hypothetical protein HY629_01135 [Candidatus Uhrbacteria bacterium]|nr:hypothetical protein [Candidatus Uhrbacteria bacterium]